MNRSRKTNSTNKRNNSYREKNHHYKKNKGKIDKVVDAKLDATERDNNPNWYYLDKNVAEQVSALSFQQLAGRSIDVAGNSYRVPNIVIQYLNPSPGVQVLGNYTGAGAQKSAINLAGFRTYSKLQAFTGRIAPYGPQDISTMILGFGEIISVIEWARRIFGIAYTMNMRNRDYPRKVVESLGVDPDDLFKNLANYKTRFNAIITRVNQLPIPKNIAYFDKCASLYEHIYLDSNSAMAQTIIQSIATTWELDESSYQGGTVLRTADWGFQHNTGLAFNPTQFVWFLDKIDHMIDLLMNSSSLQVVYTDLLNLASKQGTEFWKFAYLDDFYAVFPEYNPNFLLQFHNSNIPGMPFQESSDTNLSGFGVTPFNDVYPNANANALYYNPAFATTKNASGTMHIAGGICKCGRNPVIDMLTDSPTLEDRIEVTRFTSGGTGSGYTASTATTNTSVIDIALPDHYVTALRFFLTDNNIVAMNGTLINTNSADFRQLAIMLSTIDWAPFMFGNDDNGSYDTVNAPGIFGDLNFYTVVDTPFLRRLHDFVGLALYDLR